MMKYEILMGIPDMRLYWDEINYKNKNNELTKNEFKDFKKLIKTLDLLSNNPKHNSLSSHPIEELSKRYEIKVWQSYLENKTPAAGRIYWVYGPKRLQITILGIEPHPDDKRGAYDRIKLSRLPNLFTSDFIINSYGIKNKDGYCFLDITITNQGNRDGRPILQLMMQDEDGLLFLDKKIKCTKSIKSGTPLKEQLFLRQGTFKRGYFDIKILEVLND